MSSKQCFQKNYWDSKYTFSLTTYAHTILEKRHIWKNISKQAWQQRFGDIKCISKSMSHSHLFGSKVQALTIHISIQMILWGSQLSPTGYIQLLKTTKVKSILYWLNYVRNKENNIWNSWLSNPSNAFSYCPLSMLAVFESIMYLLLSIFS